MSTFLTDDEMWQILVQIKAEWPETRCVVLVDNDRQLREAEVAHKLSRSCLHQKTMMHRL